MQKVFVLTFLGHFFVIFQFFARIFSIEIFGA